MTLHTKALWTTCHKMKCPVCNTPSHALSYHYPHPHCIPKAFTALMHFSTPHPMVKQQRHLVQG